MSSEMAKALCAVLVERFGNRVIGVDVTAEEISETVKEVLSPPSIPKIEVTQDPDDPTRVHFEVWMSAELAAFLGLEVAEDE